MKLPLRMLAVALFVMFVTACTKSTIVSMKPNSNPTMAMQVSADSDINLDANGQALPVLVKVYQLNSPTAFQSASFNDLLKHDVVTLGPSLMHQTEFMVAPGAKTSMKIGKKSDASYIAVVAAFRNPQGNGWRAIQPMKSGGWFTAGGAKIYISGNTITL